MLPTTKKTLFKNRKTKETFKWTDKNSDGQLAVFSNLHILTPIKRLASTFLPPSFQSVSTTSSSSLSSVPFLFRFSLRLLGNLLARLPCSFLLYSLYCARLYQSFSCFHYSLQIPFPSSSFYYPCSAVQLRFLPAYPHPEFFNFRNNSHRYHQCRRNYNHL